MPHACDLAFLVAFYNARPKTSPYVKNVLRPTSLGGYRKGQSHFGAQTLCKKIEDFINWRRHIILVWSEGHTNASHAMCAEYRLQNAMSMLSCTLLGGMPWRGPCKGQWWEQSQTPQQLHGLAMFQYIPHWRAAVPKSKFVANCPYIYFKMH